MAYADLLTLREEAAEPTLGRMRTERRRASFQVQPLLLKIEEHLFDPDLSVTWLRRECRVRDREVLRRFKQQMGRTPRAYVEHARLEVAARLLANTELGVGEIGDLVGYARLATFSDAFLRCCASRPLAYRRWQRRGAGVAEIVETPVVVATDPADLRAALLSKLARLHALAEGSTVDPMRFPTPVTVEAGKLEGPLAREVWEVLRQCPWQMQRRLVREELRFSTTGLFFVLRQKSLEESRKDRERGVEIAQLALWSLQASGDLLRSELPSLLARGWAWLGNAYCLALNFPAAEEALSRAAGLLPEHGASAIARAELFFWKAALRWLQLRVDEALDLVNRAVPLFREASDELDLARALLLRSNIVRLARGPQQAVADIEEAQALLKAGRDPYLDGVLLSSWIRLHLMTGNLEGAETALSRGKKLSNASRRTRASLLWLEGKVLQAKPDPTAEQVLQAARAALEQDDELLLAAAVRLDLACLYYSKSEHEACSKQITRALPVLEALAVDESVFSVIRQLRAGALKGRVESLAVLRALQRTVVSHALAAS